MQCRSIRPQGLPHWEPLAFGLASSPIRSQHGKEVTARWSQRLLSSSSRWKDSSTPPQGPGWAYRSPEELHVHHRDFRNAALRSGLPKKERSRISAESYTSSISDTDRRIERELDATSNRPIEVLQRCIRSGLATPHVLHVCFEAQASDVKRHTRYKRLELHERLREDQLARTALIYMLQDPGKWTTILHKNTQFVDNLCYFAIIEGLQDTILRFLSLTPTPDNVHWRRKVATGLILAQDLLETSLSSDACLKLFFRLTEMRDSERARYETQKQQHKTAERPVLLKYDILSSPNTQMWTTLYGINQPLGRCQTDLDLYNRFVKWHSHFATDVMLKPQQHVDWDLAQLQLSSPVAYNEEPALKILQKYMKEGLSAFHPDPRMQAMQTRGVANFVRRTADVAEANSNMAAARWVYNTFEEEYWQGYRIPSHHVRGTLANLGSSVTHVQQRLCNAITRSESDTRRLLSERVVKAPALQPASDPAAHANKFQNILGTVTKDAKQPETQKRGFGL